MATNPPRVAAVGSYNHALTMSVEHLPAPGETVLGEAFAEGVGGKGSNQAVAAARLGAETSFVGRLGNDRFAEDALELWVDNGVDARVRHDESTHTGVGFVLVDEGGENAIAVAPGANARLSAADVRAEVDIIAEADAVMAQLETEDEPVVAAAELADEHGTSFVLDPAPARELPAELFRLTDVLTPNESEARALAGADATASPTELASRLRDLGVAAVVITLGGDGALVATEDGQTAIEAVEVDVVDTTGAGDAFTAGLAVALAEGEELVSAARFAARVGAAACTAYEVVPALPYRDNLP